MIYTQLPASYKYEVIADAIYQREVEYFHYNFDKTNFEYLINSCQSGLFKDSLAERLNSTLEQMENVRSIIEALRAQIDDEVAYAEAVDRAIAKRKAEDAG